VSAEERNKVLVRKFFEEAWVKGNVAAVDDCMAADYVEHPRPSTLSPGSEGLKQLIVAQSLDSPGEVLAQVNDALYPDIPSEMFVTSFYAILDSSAGRLRYANAGHDLPYVHHNGEGAHELRATGMPLGLMPEMSYEEKEAVLREGDSVLFYSDGLVEAHNPHYEMFGFPRLGALIAERGGERSLVDSLLEELYSFVGEGWEQEDDITLLTLKRSASPS
jgi:serine phosphatase RsbU (regulator of sigma subunit)